MSRPALSLVQSLGQHQLLLPRMLQSIEVLQLAGGELETWLRQAAEQNEALVLEEPAVLQDPGGEAGREAGPAEAEDAEFHGRPRGTREDAERYDAMLRNQPDREPPLAQRLSEQLAMLDLEEGTLGWVRLLVDCIDPSGFLSVDDATLLALAHDGGLRGGAPELARAWEVLRGLEPRGIGARNAVEALILQLDPGDPDYEDLCTLLQDFLEEIAKNKLPSVARAMGLELTELGALIDRLRELDPRPAARLAEEAAPPLRPDVLVERTEDGFTVGVESSAVPSVTIDPELEALARDRRQDRELRGYVRKKLDKARWIVDAVQQRGETLSRIAEAVFRHQHAFLEHGPGHLLPLRMNALAEELGVHVSTVSRAVAGKYAQTPWGILPLRHFFQAAAGADDDSARDDVRTAVREVFDAEDPTRPLSDDEVVGEMERRGWKLARRTVAKYRRELGIPSSYRRRKYA